MESNCEMGKLRLVPGTLALGVWMASCAATITTRVDNLILSLEWPGAYCAINNCCYSASERPAANFTIHGLWPAFSNGSQPTSCPVSRNFSAHEVVEFEHELRASWATLDCASEGQQIWAREWLFHGACAFNRPRKYFRTALRLHDGIAPLHYLVMAGVRPNGNIYRLSRIRAAIEGAIGHRITVECLPARPESSSSSLLLQLHQIQICIGKNGTDIVDCSRDMFSSCRQWVKFAPFDI